MSENISLSVSEGALKDARAIAKYLNLSLDEYVEHGLDFFNRFNKAELAKIELERQGGDPSDDSDTMKRFEDLG